MEVAWFSKAKTATWFIREVHGGSFRVWDTQIL